MTLLLTEKGLYKTTGLNERGEQIWESLTPDRLFIARVKMKFRNPPFKEIIIELSVTAPDIDSARHRALEEVSQIVISDMKDYDGTVEAFQI